MKSAWRAEEVGLEEVGFEEVGLEEVGLSRDDLILSLLTGDIEVPK